MRTRMNEQTSGVRGARPSLLLLGAVLCLGLLVVPVVHAQMPTIHVVGVAADGTQTNLDGSDYRWLVEEDLMYHVPLLGGVPQSDNDTLSVSFQRSYMPLVATGCAGSDTAWQAQAQCASLPFSDPDGGAVNHYYLSVVPRTGYQIGGAAFDDGDTDVTVYVNQWPIPTAQITILVFEDNFPINNVPDLPGEDPANPGNTDMSGFQIVVEDGGGRYGAASGIQSQDAFGHPLGTQYDVNGNVIGWQPLVTGPDGVVVIKNLAPGKYGITAVPPAGMGWQQTSTIEGTKINDAWVKAAEPGFFAEFGPPGYHVFLGYIREFNNIPAGGGATISGTVVNQHMSRPPDYTFYDGLCFGHTTPWVGLNDMAVGTGQGIYAAPTDGNCQFSIPNVPDGNYQLGVFDENLDLIFAFKGVTITDGQCNTPSGSCNLGEVPVFQWFHRQEWYVYNDINGNGVWDDGEPPINDQVLNLRWRDGTLYQTNVTDFEGAFAFDQVFPFFSWLVAEVDYGRFQATGLKVTVDNGGPINPADPSSYGGLLTPQDQTNPPDPACADPSVCIETTKDRIDLGPVLLAGFQGFLGQTNVFEWGKRHYPDGVNGGFTGVVYYDTTRAENDPRLAAAEPWEPGIPNVQINLYDATGSELIATTTSDSWDDNTPTGCKWGNGASGPFHYDPDGPGPLGTDTDCYDGLRVFNQVRPAVFDGGFAFGPDVTCGELATGNCDAYTAVGSDGKRYFKPGDYVLEVVPPPGYELYNPENKNVDFGDERNPAPALVPPPCVGPDHAIPDYLTLYPDQQIAAPFAGTSRPDCSRKLLTMSAGSNPAADFFLFTHVPIAAHAVGFILDDTQNEFDPNSPNFGEKYAPPFLPITIRDWTGRVIGQTLSDQYGVYNFLTPSTTSGNLPQPSGVSPNMLTACMNDPGDDPNNPDPNWNQQYSTFCYTLQYMPGATTYLDTPVVPVAAYAGPDQFPLDCEYPDGTPRIYSVDVQGNGVGGGPYIATYGGQNNARLAGTPSIVITSVGTMSVINPNYCNPAAGACPAGSDTTNKLIARDFGFGNAQGSVTLVGGRANRDDATNALIAGKITSWSDTQIVITFDGADSGFNLGPVGGRQLMITRGDNGQATKVGVTVQVGLRQGANVVQVGPPPAGAALDHTLQDAIDAAGRNDLLLVRPGQYNEMVVMWKPVQLQAWGEGSTIISAIKAPANKLDEWRTLVNALISSGSIDLLPGQEVGTGTPEPITLWHEEGAGVLVLSRASGRDSFNRNAGARVDGFTIKSADTGGGIIVNGYADYLDVSNNRITNNNGFYGGGIRVGHPELTAEQPDGTFGYTDGDNDYVRVHHNQVVFNGGLGGAGGGISMCTGSDSYQVTSNWVCGNFSISNGGGIGHIGKSDGSWILYPNVGPQSQRVWTLVDPPLIADNTVIFNENFYQGLTVSGGGIFIGGGQPLTAGTLSPGAGNLRVIGNLIQGNSAGAGDGGGMRLAMVNGEDVAANPGNVAPRNGNEGRFDPRPWYAVDLYNNMIVDNSAGLAGGGISLQDAVEVRIRDNTIANNESLATAGEAFSVGNPNQSNPQPGAGVVSRSHSAALQAASAGVGTFSTPSVFAQNIIWQNRQFYFYVDSSSGCQPGNTSCTSTFGLCPDPSGTLACPAPGTALVFDDLGVLGAAGALTCTDCLTTPGGWTAPAAGDPSALFVSEYFNGPRSSVLGLVQPEITTAIEAPAAFDEGGNFIRARFGPLSLYQDATTDGDPGTLFGDYHIIPGSAAHDSASGGLDDDFDGDVRPQGGGYDFGADEIAEAAPVAAGGAAAQAKRADAPAASRAGSSN